MGYFDPNGTNELERQRIERETTILNHKYSPLNPYINTNLKLYKNDTTLSYLERDSSADIETEGKGGDIRNSFELDNNLFLNKLTLGADYEEEEGISDTGRIKYKTKVYLLQNRMAFEKSTYLLGQDTMISKMI